MNNGNIVSTEMILTSNFVKYNRLRELIGYAFANSKATSINLYIDLYGVVKTLFSDSFRTDISDYTSLISTILNMCGHYRSFFKGIGVYCKIFIVFSYNTCDINRKLVAEYNNKFFKKTSNNVIREMVELNNSLLETICPFINDIHFLKTEFESSVLMDYLIRTGDGNPNIVISKDIYPCQLTYLHDNTAFIKPKKLNGEDLSTIVPTRDNINFMDDFWNMYCHARGSLINISRSSIWIHPANFTLLAALTRFPERNFNSLMNLTTANKLIFGIVGREPIKISVGSLVEYVQDKNIPVVIAENRQKSIDVEFFRGIFTDSTEPGLIRLDNLNDPASVNMICSEYFKDNPVDLTKL